MTRTAPQPTDAPSCPAAVAATSCQGAVAAPSCVVPGRIPENCARLAQLSGIVTEIGLALFEAEACLAYGEEDLPPGLGEKMAGLGMGFHAHLPLDLDWPATRAGDWRGPWAKIVALERMFSPLAPRALVLHPPPPSVPPRELARAFAEIGRDPATVLIENVRDCDLDCDLQARAGEFLEAGFSFCLDLGHMLAYGQESLARRPDVLAKTRMLHLNAPDPARPSRHLGLDHLDQRGLDLLRELLAAAPQATRMVEVFSWQALVASLAVLEREDRDKTEAGAC